MSDIPYIKTSHVCDEWCMHAFFLFFIMILYRQRRWVHHQGQHFVTFFFWLICVFCGTIFFCKEGRRMMMMMTILDWMMYINEAIQLVLMNQALGIYDLSLLLCVCK